MEHFFGLFFFLGFKVSYSEYSFVTQIVISGIMWIHKFWLLRYLFATHFNMCTMIVRWRNSLSALLNIVLELSELLKWITKSYWNLSELGVSDCKHICHYDRFIFCITFWVFHNSNKSKLLTLIKKIHMFNCSTNCLYRIRIATNGSTSLLNENF